jgi:hypothetical protein
MSDQQLPPCKEFYVSINTKKDAVVGVIRGVKITIEEDIIGLDEEVRIDLADHPLYPHLQQYVLANLKKKG